MVEAGAIGFPRLLMVTIQSLEVSSQVPIERRVKDLKFALSLSQLLAIVFYCRAGRLKKKKSFLTTWLRTT